MNNYAGEEYIACKQWIADKIQHGFDWNQVIHLCIDEEHEIEEFGRLQNEELIIPPNMDFSDWAPFVSVIHSNYSQITDLYGISDRETNNLGVPTDGGSAWVRYKNLLLGKNSGKAKFSSDAVDTLENNCHWMLNHLERDTRASGPVKGLVMGSVQSGKTANMIGLVTMAAHYDWNIFIVLSGTIDNLRKQTRNRFYSDLTDSGGVSWHVLDYTSNPDYMVDIETSQKYMVDDLSLNIFQDGRSTNKWLHRYVVVCLKNSRRLQNLITWLHSNPSRTAKMRILVIDDEADQASVNTVKMGCPRDEEEIERTAVNQMIIDLVRGCDCEGNVSASQFQAMNYICFTATPYANVLNEAYKESLYPSNFICTLPESNEYFGVKAIWGSKSDEDYSGLNIIRTISEEEMKEIKLIHKGDAFTLPEEFQKSIAWFLSAAAVLRYRGHKKPISMLIHTTAIQNGHFEEYEVLRSWLKRESATGKILILCNEVYEAEKENFRLSDLKEGYPKYANLDKVCDVFPNFEDIKEDIYQMLYNIINIELGDEKQLIYHEDGIHLCVDNCSANRIAEEGTYLRIVYPTDEELAGMKKAPVFIIMGGNTLSRGLTLEGLVCTYFARNVNQADTLMQMARWFGYRHEFELLQRIWMTEQVQRKFELIEEIDEKLKAEFEDFMKKGKSPSLFGPRILSSSKIARFMLTSKNKSQNMVACDVDFSGDSYEVTQFEDSEEDLRKNINVTEDFLQKLGAARKSDAVNSAYSWNSVDSEYVISEFLEKYKIFDCSPLHVDIPIFVRWIQQMNKEGRYLKWNIAIAGDAKAEERWTIASVNVGKIERSRKTTPKYIDIGSLRSGRDILSDVCVDELSAEKRKLFVEGKKRGKKLIQLRYDLGLEDVPLLLIYRIDCHKGKESKYRTKIGTKQDIIGFSIVISSQEINADYIRTVQVRRPEYR
ncbi:MAG: Z1 domain-containing protein [Lachnospiraceae bacterium]|nr:Z1 domain-containing protein [Lachnospiraceae bacterium]